MAAEADPYRLLGVSRYAGLDDVRQAYRLAALRYHPDSRPADPVEAERKFRAVCEAYRTILATFGPRAGRGDAFDPGATFTPADFARREGGWTVPASAPRASSWGERAWWPWPTTQKVAFVTVNETRVFVAFWALAVVVGAAVTFFAAELGIIPRSSSTADTGNLLAAFGAAVAVYLAMLAGTIVAIFMTRKLVTMTVQLGLRLLPAPLRRKRGRHLPRSNPDS